HTLKGAVSRPVTDLFRTAGRLGPRQHQIPSGVAATARGLALLVLKMLFVLWKTTQPSLEKGGTNMIHFIKYWSLAIVLVFLAAGFAHGQPPPPDNKNDEVIFAGFLSCGGDDARACPFRLHYVTLEQGRTYAFRIDSTEFDARMTIEDLSGKVLASEGDCT